MIITDKEGITPKQAYKLAGAKYGWTELVRMAADSGLKRESKVITYAKNVFIPVTTFCRNRCGYCGYVHDGMQKDAPSCDLITPQEAMEIFRLGAEHGCSEALIVSGERPEEVSPEIEVTLRSWGFADFISYLIYLCESALKMGLLPHTNAGLLTFDELKRLRQVNVSMGLMLENVSARLCGSGNAHQFSPGKNPRDRLRHIEDAGKLGIPFTSGILVGIGETEAERAESLLVLREVQRKYGHIQELIIQNFCPKKNTPMAHCPEPPAEDLFKTAALCRLLFGPSMNIQAPPNLNAKNVSTLIEAGVNDLGGVSPVTEDEINPEKPWPAVGELRGYVCDAGCSLLERLPVYPEKIDSLKKYSRIYKIIMEKSDSCGFVKSGMVKGNVYEN